MPIKVSNNLPATKILNNENIFVMTERRALHQDIRPLKLLIVNIMPTKITTETQLLRALSNTPLQVEVEFVNMQSHAAQNTPPEHLRRFYKTFDAVKTHHYDGVIITGAPVEHLEFENVDYWQELCRVMEWTKKHATSTMHICWAAQAALYYHYGIKKYPLKEKMFGVFEHHTLKTQSRLTRGFDDSFMAPHSRHAYVKKEDIEATGKLEVLCESSEAGVYLVKSKNDKQVFVMGHSEYEYDTLDGEYKRDKARGADIAVPKHYYPFDDPKNTPPVTWRSHNHLLFTNWLNYFVYQTTPYELQKDDEK